MLDDQITHKVVRKLVYGRRHREFVNSDFIYLLSIVNEAYVLEIGSPPPPQPCRQKENEAESRG